MLDKIRKFFTIKRIIFIVIFVALILIGSRIPLFEINGAKGQYFTFFEFFGPLGGAFLGPIIGAFTVLISQISNYILSQKAFDVINILRLLPMLFAAYYFGTHKNKKDPIIIVPLLCMAAFMLHPVGSQVWYFSLYWLIPVIAKFSNRLFIRSLGTTFTAHAVGATLWLYALPMAVEQYHILIPVVAYERIVFALGITVSYLCINTLLNKVETIAKSIEINIDPRYVIERNFAKLKTLLFNHI